MPRRNITFRLRASRLYLGYAVLSLALAMVAFVAREDLIHYFDIPPRIVLFVIGAFALQGFLLLLQLYLRGDLSLPVLDNLLIPVDSTDQDSDLESRAIRRLHRKVTSAESALGSMQNEIRDLQARLAAAPPNAAPSFESERVLDSLRQHVTQSLATEIEARLQERIRETLYAVSAARTLETASLRLRTEIASLNRRANVNLLIGVATTAIAVSLLVYMVLSAEITFDSWPGLLAHYIPRITTVVFIEVFSFFFLRLYRTSLEEIKYYQNELTTFDAQRVALDAANQADNADARNAVIVAIGKTDRNRDDNLGTARERSKKGIKDAADMLEQLAKIASAAMRKSSPGKDDGE